MKVDWEVPVRAEEATCGGNGAWDPSIACDEVTKAPVVRAKQVGPPGIIITGGSTAFNQILKVWV